MPVDPSPTLLSVPRVVTLELCKAFTFPAIPRTLAVGTIGLAAAATFIVDQAHRFAAHGHLDALGGLTCTSMVTLLLHYGQVIPILLGAWMIGQDNPTGARRRAFLVTARRGRAFMAQLASAALLALLAALGCLAAALAPLAWGGEDPGLHASEITAYCWQIGYWVLIAMVANAVAAATRNLALTVVPILVWTIGLSPVLAARIPWLSGALDQVFASAYLQGGTPPSLAALMSAAAQVAAAIGVGALLFCRRDTH